MAKKRIAILGSTGSIGESTLRVVKRYPNRFSVVALAAWNNVAKLKRQIAQFKPKYAAISKDNVDKLKDCAQKYRVQLLTIEEDLSYMASLNSVDAVVLGLRGAQALEPFLEAAKAGKLIAPANKEALVIAGELIMAQARKHKATIVPVDSEQSAIFQCLHGEDPKNIHCVHLTASGGALRKVPKTKFNKLSHKQILNHPRWSMGDKITVDSATLMNKGFEVIEAQRLFDLSYDQIKVVVHPEAIIHSMVEFNDGSILAQLSVPDMQLPIQYALSYPGRWPSKLERIDFLKMKSLNFEAPDMKKFPCLALAFEVAKKGGSLPCVLNAADEVVVEAFLNKQIKFNDIYDLVAKIVRKHKVIKKPNLKQIKDVDQYTREEAQRILT